MTAIDADGTEFVFGGQVVGGITSYQVFDGTTPQTEHNPMNGPRCWLPGKPEWGRIRVTLYRDPSDPGQAAMASARSNRRTETAQWTLIDGTTYTFPVNVEVLPIAGDDINGVGTAQVVLKVAGEVS